MTTVFNDQYYAIDAEFLDTYEPRANLIDRPFRLPTLYTYTKSTDKYRVYTVGFDGTNIVSESGQIGGKMRVVRSKIKLRGNNSEYTQGLIDARSRWKKKMKERYSESMQEVQGMMNRQVMLANKFDISKIVEYPIWMQIKYDGIRFVAGLCDGEVILRSRIGNEFHHMNHLREELLPILEDLAQRFPDVEDILIDGELFVPGETFQQTCSIIKCVNEVHERNDEIVAMIFDIMIPEPYENRWTILSEYIDIEESDSPIRLIDTRIARDPASIQTYFDRIISEGHEGVMIRDPRSQYVNGRTNALMKMKNIETDEGIIKYVTEGVGTHQGLAIFVIEDSLGIETHIVPAATQEQRREWFDDRQSLIGLRYRFMFNERMKGTNAPRNPVGLCIVDE